MSKKLWMPVITMGLTLAITVPVVTSCNDGGNNDIKYNILTLSKSSFTQSDFSAGYASTTILASALITARPCMALSVAGRNGTTLSDFMFATVGQQMCAINQDTTKIPTPLLIGPFTENPQWRPKDGTYTLYGKALNAQEYDQFMKQYDADNYAYVIPGEFVKVTITIAITSS